MSGGCLCGAVRYQVSGNIKAVANCHCSMCRRHSGAAFLTYAAVETEAFTIEQGRTVPYRSSGDAVCSHCGTCGSPLTFTFDSDPGTVWLTAGSFDDPNAVAPMENWYVKTSSTGQH